ncbi:regulatory protein, Fis family [Dethiosulfatibacter aminovorans DSM 17477]|uniref:Regulatory protein, Fis family n=2 Tax=Dethiosulfatibacter TaxID=448125 RepID=A0A1M6ADN3_9FIRM|nr:regulatory protein, Fis family [Dethiosulfatibacter aminovorans DSM 17477]
MKASWKLLSDMEDIIINRIMPLREAREMLERELITRAMEEAGSTYKAARLLKVSQATVARKSKKYQDDILTS